VETLGKFAFLGCAALSTVTFERGSKLSSLEDYVFVCCSSLSAIHIPDSLKEILSEWRSLLIIDQ
jgi:hypothetical protein